VSIGAETEREREKHSVVDFNWQPIYEFETMRTKERLRYKRQGADKERRESKIVVTIKRATK
jgi:hypothetical protein